MRTTCIVLAGGLGTRLRSAVQGIPKCLAPIDGQPFLKWQLYSLADRGVEHFLLALGHGANIVLDSLKETWTRGLSIDTVTEDKLLGTGGAARFAMATAGLDEVLIANGDTFLGGSLNRMLEPLALHEGEFMRIATVQMSDRSRFGGVEVNAERHVTAFLEKGHTGAGQINAGLYRIHRCAFDREEGSVFSMETQVMPHLVAINALQARVLTGPFIDIGIPADYRLFNSCVHDYVDKV